jgi:hypothetical protein
MRLSLIDVRRIDRRWMLITTVTPGIASDLEQALEWKDWIFMGSIQVRRQVRRTLSWGAGLAYANYFGQPQVLPVLSLNWRDEGKWSLEALLPSKAGVWYADCGLLQHGFLRLRCPQCNTSRVVPFSCKRRTFCPSCMGRRMADTAARLVDQVFPRVPVRPVGAQLPDRDPLSPRPRRRPAQRLAAHLS